MASQFSTNGATASAAGTAAGTPLLSINDIPKSWTFTSKHPPDRMFPTPALSHSTPREQITSRIVRDAVFTWVRPETVASHELLAISPAAMRDLGIREGDEKTDDFRNTVVGNVLHGWDERTLEGGYPWAQCYGGFQFGEWAGQLGDGRVISLFETTNPNTGVRNELQLKGAGQTPYSRFADGLAALRSSIREFVVSEALNALGIPTTRALSLTVMPSVRVFRERIEPAAIVARFAPSWMRIGTFDIVRARGDRYLIRHLATYVAEEVFGGWETLPGRPDDPEKPAESPSPRRGIPADEIEGPDDTAENRFVRVYREIVRRNALTVAKWQAYGFMNGVLNSDNTSLSGLSMDFGPFAFMDNFDPNYTPNHDDVKGRYSYGNQPGIIWWNLVRLGEALGEYLGVASKIDDPYFVEHGVKQEEVNEIVDRAETIIIQIGVEYRAVFLEEYRRLMSARLGLKTQKESDFHELFNSLLNTMEVLELDFNFFFRRLSLLKVTELETEEARRDKAGVFFYSDGVTGFGDEEADRQLIGEWLCRWRLRILEDWGDGQAVSDEQDGERMRAMKGVNPNFTPRSWILNEVITRVQKYGERGVLDRLVHLSLHPFEDSWAGRTFDGKEYQGDAEEEMRWTSDVPRESRAQQCSCSS
ncbi:UPF0061-domain-containing protein [Durotheca rogersii]|uniref:UPF0061-domain-containing protein n=1 Tax=Durotheca rogersii TaxID=419775 RepID=UPI00221E656C|nr:UPF0061-domain-containing protein [Durotheca rogersii]KAI5864189.1 UPF0061-domain-containing protein [Durotheca rogersii]